MKQIGYQGYAQAEGFDPIRAPRESIEQIAAHGRRVIRGMEAVRDQDMKNRRAYAAQLERKFNVEERNRAQNKQLEDQNRELVNKWQNINTRIKVENYETEAKRWQAIAGLSQTAAKTANELYEQKYEADLEDEYYKTLWEGPPVESQLAHDEAMHNLRIGGEAIEQEADVLQARGVPQDSVEQVRSLNPARRVGRQKALAEMAGRRWESWVEEQFAVNDRTQISVPDGAGGVKVITPSQAGTSAERAATMQVLLRDYLKLNALDGAKPEFLAPMMQRIRQSTDEVIARTRKAEAQQSAQMRIDESMDAFYDAQTPESAYDLVLTTSRQIDPRTGAPVGLRGGRMALYEAMKQVDEYGNLVVNDHELAEILNMTFPGMNKPIGEQYSHEIAKLRRERQDVVSSNYAANERATDIENDRWTDEAEAWLKDNPQASREEIEGLIETAVRNGNSDGARRLAGYIQYTPEGQQDKYYEEEVFPQLYMTGQLGREDVMRAPISQEAKMKWIDRAKEAEANAIDKDTWKMMEDTVKNDLRGKLGAKAIDETIDGTFFQAKLHAERKMRADYMRGVRSGMNPQQAEKFAVDNFRAELQKEGGSYAINEPRIVNGKAVGLGGFKNFGINSTEYSRPDHAQLSQKLRNDPRGLVDVLKEDVVIDPAESLRYVRGIEQGRRVAPPDQAQWIADQTGGRLSPFDVMNLQLQAAGIRNPGVQPVENFRQSISPEYQRLINYKPSPTRTDIALIGSGMPRVNTTPLQKQALDVIGKYESDPVGGYNAMNEGGTNGGRTVVGYSGHSKGRLGKNLTDMTVGEIIQLQQQGRLHAAGRYQFIGNTLPGVVRDAKVDLSAKFDQSTQDLLGLTLMRQRGIQPWIGPADKATAAERRIVEQAMREPIQVAGSTPWRNTQNMRLEVIEYLTGDPSHAGYRDDHAGARYHEHLAFATREQRDAAMARLQAHGIRIGSVDRPGDPGYHGSGLAFDVPADQVPVGKEQELSRRVRAILGMN